MCWKFQQKTSKLVKTCQNIQNWPSKRPKIDNNYKTSSWFLGFFENLIKNWAVRQQLFATKSSRVCHLRPGILGGSARDFGKTHLWVKNVVFQNFFFNFFLLSEWHTLEAHQTFYYTFCDRGWRLQNLWMVWIQIINCIFFWIQIWNRISNWRHLVESVAVWKCEILVLGHRSDIVKQEKTINHRISSNEEMQF